MKIMKRRETDRVGVLVAHPDDETLWAGGLLLLHPGWQTDIAAVCRASDPDRAPRFAAMLACYGASGRLADLDDGPAQTPLPPALVEQTVVELVAERAFDLLLTHGPRGEYTWHARHGEVSRAVAALWQAGRVRARELWLFAYRDAGHGTLPHACPDAHCRLPLPAPVWAEKHRLVREIYGFAPESWEARATPRTEAFWRFTTPAALADWLSRQEDTA